jgi:type IV secretory pathway TraG/TraD family ATPase VirD4
MDTAALASSFIRANPNPMADSSSDSFFRTSSRTLLESIFRAVQPHEPEAIKTLLAQSREQIKKALTGTPAAPLIDPQAHDQGAGIIATAANAVKPLEYLPARNTSPRTWSARNWAEQPGSWLFLASTEDSRSAVAPLQAAWMDTIIRWLMTHEIGDAPVWIIIDELSTLGYLPELERMVVRGRKRGLCVVMGFQNVSQLRSTYGRDRATTLISAPSTKVIMRCDEAETAKWASELLGSREIERINMTALTGLSAYREGMNLQSHRSNEHIVTPAEIQLLKPFQGYLCVAGHDRTTLKIPPLYLRQTHPGFMPRRTGAATPKQQNVATITAEAWLN